MKASIADATGRGVPPLSDAAGVVGREARRVLDAGDANLAQRQTHARRKRSRVMGTTMFKAFLAAIVIGAIGTAQPQDVKKIEIYEFGTYIASPATQVGFSRQGVPQTVVDRIDLIDATDTVIAQIGAEFGFRFRIIGTPRAARVPVTFVMRYPEPGLLAPKKSVPFVEDVYMWPGSFGDHNFRTLKFETRSDLVPGIWTVELWVGGKKFAEQKFNVILPPIS